MTTIGVTAAVIVSGLVLMIFVAKVGVKILPAAMIIVLVGAALGAALDAAFDSFPKLAGAGAVVALVGLVGASLEKLSGE